MFLSHPVYGILLWPPYEPSTNRNKVPFSNSQVNIKITFLIAEDEVGVNITVIWNNIYWHK